MTAPKPKPNLKLEVLKREAWRVNEWSRKTGVSEMTTYRRIKDGSLRTIKYGGMTLILGFADTAAE